MGALAVRTMWCDVEDVHVGRNISLAECSSLLHGNHSPLRSSQMHVDTALESTEADLSNAVSTSGWKAHRGEWLAFKREVDAAGISAARPSLRTLTAGG